MLHDNVRSFLRSVSQLTSRSQLAYERWQRLQATAESMTARYGDAPSGGKTDPHKDAVWQSAIAAREQFRSAYNAAAEREQEVAMLVDRLPKQEHRVLLHYRYLAGLRWSDVLKSMEKHNLYYSERQMFNLHGEALKALRKIYREGDDTDVDS